MRRDLAVGLALVLAIAGCGSDGRRERAFQMAGIATRALELVDRTSGSESLDGDARAAIDPARETARSWAAQTHAAVDLWGTSDSRSLALETAAPCLGRALGALRERLAEHHRPIPESLPLVRSTSSSARVAVPAIWKARSRRPSLPQPAIASTRASPTARSRRTQGAPRRRCSSGNGFPIES